MFRKKAVLITIIVIILFAYFLFLVFPLVLVGSPTALFYIQNENSFSHNVSIEIFDEQNVSVFNTSYLLEVNESVHVDREIRWYFPFPSTFVTWSDGVYTFHFTVDNNASNQITRDINQYESISADIESSENQSESVDIIIRILAV